MNAPQPWEAAVGMSGTSSRTEPHAPDPRDRVDSAVPSAACAALAEATPVEQLALLERSPSCAADFMARLTATPDRYLDAFLLGIESPAVSDALWQASYDELAAGRLRFEPPVIDALLARMPAAVAACANTHRCDEWQTWILGPLERGQLYTCPSTAGRPPADLVAILPYADDDCTEAIARELAPVADAAVVADVAAVARSHRFAWGRRNGLRVLGRFAERGTTQGAGFHVVNELGRTVAATATEAIATATFEAEVHDAIWLLDSYFFPYRATQSDLQNRALNDAADPTLRFRAISAWSRLVWTSPAPLVEADITFFEAALTFADPWVRAQVAFTIDYLDPALLTPAAERRLAERLRAAFASERDLSARVYEARALDRLLGGQRALEVREAYEAQALSRTATTANITLRSGLPAADLPYWLGRLDAVQDAFFDLLGTTVATPVADDQNQHWTVVVFATPREYRDYMRAFVGFGAYAGGLYLEREATLYTYQRTASQSSYTLEELLQHELTHALTGRFVFPGVWGDAGYHDEPKGWLDEGLAEVMAGLTPGSDNPLPPRDVPLRSLCAQPIGSLSSLLDRRTGYDQPGTFDYARAWAFVYYLVRRSPDVLDRVVASYRDGTYSASDFAATARVTSIGDLEDDWHNTVQAWCSSESPHPQLHAHHAVVRCQSSNACGAL